MEFEEQKKALIEYWEKSGIVRDKRLIEAFLSVPREEFVLPTYRHRAYDDVALPIIAGQTISQPTTIMIMLQALEPKQDDIVLEIGAGSGYNAALLSKLVKKVYTVEILEEVANYAKKNLEKLNIKNVEVIISDGSLGYKKAAPYDKIIVTAACPEIPKPLIDQLKDNGILVAPVGSLFEQKMLKVVKKKGKLIKQDLGEFVFVPLHGKHGFQAT